MDARQILEAEHGLFEVLMCFFGCVVEKVLVLTGNLRSSVVRSRRRGKRGRHVQLKI